MTFHLNEYIYSVRCLLSANKKRKNDWKRIVIENFMSWEMKCLDRRVRITL
jgi:hypothetical protein